MLTLHLGMRGRDEHYKLTDLEVKQTTDGKKYVQLNERDTKTRTGETGSISAEDVEHTTKYRSMPSSTL